MSDPITEVQRARAVLGHRAWGKTIDEAVQDLLTEMQRQRLAYLDVKVQLDRLEGRTEDMADWTRGT